MPNQSAEVSPRHHNALPFRTITATLHAIQQHYCCTSWRVWMLRRSVAIKPLSLLALADLGDTSALRWGTPLNTRTTDF